MGAWERIKAADRINAALAGNKVLNTIKDAITELQDTRIHSARTGNYFAELRAEWKLLGMIEGVIGQDHSEAREAIRDELRSEYNYDIVEDKRIRPDGELAA